MHDSYKAQESVHKSSVDYRIHIDITKHLQTAYSSCSGSTCKTTHGPLNSTDCHFSSPQLDTSLHYQTTDTGLVHRVVCMFTPQLLCQYQITLLDDGTY